ncbi:MAG: RNA polymerase sigma-70 factor [Mangrovibacterium sp.]|nr:RNA polymerase sigma-70 factor [Mangrovibacterium sp.]
MPEFSREIVTRFVNGDEDAFKFIFHFFYPRIYHFVRSYIPGDDLSEDVVQDTFLILWNKRNDLKADTNINAWLYTVARNACLKKIRDGKSKKELLFFHLNELELGMNVEALAKVDTSELVFREIEQIITDTLAGLPPQCRKIFEMSRFENKKNAEIAGELDISVKAVENQMTKALKIFRNTLKDYLPVVAYLFFC